MDALKTTLSDLWINHVLPAKEVCNKRDSRSPERIRIIEARSLHLGMNCIAI
jgi:hypothetical protein